MKPIAGFSKYLIADDGTVIGPRGHAISPHLNKGVLAVKIHNDAGARIAVPIHRAVADAYIGGAKGMRVRHKNGDIKNNQVENLEIYSQTPTREQKQASTRARYERYKANGGDRVLALQLAANKAYRQRLRTDPAYAEKYAARKADTLRRVGEWVAANPDRAKETNRRVRQRWEKENPHLSVAKVQRRNAAKIKATPAWADNSRINRIYYIAQRVTAVTGIEHHVDHVIPLRGKLVSGLHVPENLMVVAYDYNCSKANKYEV